jgi:hypothetical protein
MFFSFKDQLTKLTSQSVELVINILYKAQCKATISFSDLAKHLDVAESLITALSLQLPLVSDLCGQGSNMVLILKITYIVPVLLY